MSRAKLRTYPIQGSHSDQAHPVYGGKRYTSPVVGYRSLVAIVKFCPPRLELTKMLMLQAVKLTMSNNEMGRAFQLYGGRSFLHTQCLQLFAEGRWGHEIGSAVDHRSERTNYAEFEYSA